MVDILDEQDFDGVCQQYRHAPRADQKEVIRCFEELKSWIRLHFQERRNGGEDNVD